MEDINKCDMQVHDDATLHYDYIIITSILFDTNLNLNKMLDCIVSVECLLMEVVQCIYYCNMLFCHIQVHRVNITVQWNNVDTVG